jgi:prolyl-tRNA synthetase
MLMPLIQPADLWKRSGRYAIEELFKLEDRRGAELVLAMTHEEAATSHVAQVVRSYRDLPLILYHLQTKGRDEPRPRAGVLRTREFVMKDSYSFDRDQAGLEESYAKHIEAYDRIFDRVGLRWYRVAGDVGLMGGTGAHEYMAPCAAGENDVALAPGYAANVEVASAEAQGVALDAPLDVPLEVATPDARTIVAVADQLSLPTGALLKAFPVITETRGLLMRGSPRAHTSSAPTAPASTSVASSRVVTSSSPASTFAASRPATSSAVTRSRSSLRSRSATSSNSVRATRRRSAPPTWTSTARSS